MSKYLNKYQLKQTLPKQVWNDDFTKLKPQIKEKLIQIYQYFMKSSQKFDQYQVEDVILVGSLCGYNYNQYSDFDLHIVLDFSIINKDQIIVKNMFDFYSNIFNNKHQISIKNRKVQLYVQDKDQQVISNGIYSVLKDKWIYSPQKDKKQDTQVEKDNINKLYKKILISIKNNYNNLQGLKEVKKRIKNMRKRGLQSKKAQFSIQNLTFKMLRNKGIIQNLNNRIYKLVNLQFTMQKQNFILQMKKQQSNRILQMINNLKDELLLQNSPAMYINGNLKFKQLYTDNFNINIDRKDNSITIINTLNKKIKFKDIQQLKNYLNINNYIL